VKTERPLRHFSTSRTVTTDLRCGGAVGSDVGRKGPPHFRSNSCQALTDTRPVPGSREGVPKVPDRRAAADGSHTLHLCSIAWSSGRGKASLYLHASFRSSWARCYSSLVYALVRPLRVSVVPLIASSRISPREGYRVPQPSHTSSSAPDSSRPPTGTTHLRENARQFAPLFSETYMFPRGCTFPGRYGMESCHPTGRRSGTEALVTRIFLCVSSSHPFPRGRIPHSVLLGGRGTPHTRSGSCSGLFS